MHAFFPHTDVLGIGQYATEITCGPVQTTSQLNIVGPNDIHVWYFSKTTIDDGHPIRIDGKKYTSKRMYSKAELTITNITTEDEGYYILLQDKWSRCYIQWRLYLCLQ